MDTFPDSVLKLLVAIEMLIVWDVMERNSRCLVKGITWNIHCNFLSSPLSNVPRQSSGKKEKKTSQCAIGGGLAVIQHESRMATPDCLVRVEERLRGRRERR